jgi:uncharacterized OB-fold protein
VVTETARLQRGFLLAEQRRRMKALYHLRLRLGTCPRCGDEPLPGRKLCGKCKNGKAAGTCLRK